MFEITALLATALAARVLFLPAFWKVSPQACVAVALFLSILVYAGADRGQLFAYFGWVHPCRRIFWLSPPIVGDEARRRETACWTLEVMHCILARV